MRSILIIALANIRKRKVQTLLIALTILMTVALFSTAIGILTNLKSPFVEMFDNLHGSHVVMELDEQYHSKEDVNDWWSSNSEVYGVEFYPYKTISDNVTHNGLPKSIGSYMMTERENKAYNIDKLMFVEGSEKLAPDNNEIWVPTGYAYAWDINVNDTLIITLNEIQVTFIVSAIVVDPQYSASMMNPVRLWINEGTLETYYDQEDLGKYLVGIRLNDFGNYNKLWQDFEDYLGTPFFGFVYDYDFIEYLFSFLQAIIAMIMLVFSIIILTVSVFIIAFTIINGILYDYKAIGVLKTQGFSASNIKMIYIIQYLGITMLMIPIGLLCSRPLINTIMNQMTRSLGLAQLNPSMAIIIIMTSLVVLGIVLFATLLSSRRAVKIKPVQAIQNTLDSGKNVKRGLSLNKIKSLPVYIMLGIKGIFHNKRHSLFILVSSIVLSFVLGFSVNVFNSVKNMDDNYAFWGFDETHVFISIESSEDAMSMQDTIDYLESDERVHTAVAYGVLIDGAIAAQDDITSTNGIAFVYSGNMDGMGHVNLEGNNPMGDNEISISYLVARKYNKSPGDEIEVFIAGEKRVLTVSGIYQSLNAGGWGFKISDKVILASNPDYELSNFSLKLKDKKNINSFVSEFNSSNEGVYIAKSVYDSGEINIEGLTSSMAMVSLILSTIFGIIASIIIFNFILIDIKNNKKELGVYKAIGLKTIELRLSLVIKVLILSLIGIAIGLPLSLSLTPKLLGIFLIDMGLVSFPFDISVIGTLLVIPVALAINLISVWLSTANLKAISLRELIIE